MKKLTIFIICAISSFCSVILAQTPVKLTIKVENIEEAKGDIYVGIYNTEESYIDRTGHVKGLRLPSCVPSVQGTVEIPAGKYAISVYHDINSNGKLDENMLGIPKEPYGISNGITRPNFQKALISVEGDTDVVINIDYF